MSTAYLRARSWAALLIVISAVLGAAWSRYVALVARRPAKWGSGRAAMIVSSALLLSARWLGLTVHNETLEKSPKMEALNGRQILACWHPHGIYVMAPFLFHSAGPRNRQAITYQFFTAVAGACFRLPFFREVLMLVNARIADRKMIDDLLGAGKSVFLCPGGIYEQLATDPRQERVFFPPNLGFVRQALQHGVPLVPTYNFGENQLYDIPQWSRAVSRWLKTRLNIGFPLGVGRWGLPFVPRKQHISIRVGSAVEVGPAESAPSEERVLEVFRRYCIQLRHLFDEYKGTDLPPDVAARGLELVWRGHEAEDLSEHALLSRALTDDPDRRPPEDHRRPPPAGPRSRPARRRSRPPSVHSRL